MIKQFKYKNITWVDVNSPTAEEISSVAKEYKLHTVVAGELTEPSLRSKVDVYDDFIYLILHFPNHYFTGIDDHKEQKKSTHEVDFVIGKDFVITACYESLEPLQEFSKILEMNSLLDKSKKSTHAGYLFYYIIRHLYQSLETGLDTINVNLRRAESKIFDGEEKEMVMELANINRNLLDFRWALKSHREVLESLEIAGKEFFGDSFGYYLRAVTGEFQKIWNLIESNSETFEDLRSTNESLLTIKANEIMQTLTIMAFVTFPLTLLAAIFGMNTKEIPIIGMPYDFWIVLGLMVSLMVLMFGFFKHKKWL